MQLWDINMDSGPVSTFQVHEYLRPKVYIPSHRFYTESLPVFFLSFFFVTESIDDVEMLTFSYAIYMKMIQSSINLSAV